jgi:hypothetical protein
LWNNIAHVALVALDGLPCLILGRQAFGSRGERGEGVCFLDPRTLLPVRRPLVIREFVAGMTIAGGRWLVTTLLQDRTAVRNRIVIWDLDSEDEEPIGAWFERRGDLYDAIVIAQQKESFQTIQVYHSFDERSFELCRFDWPPGGLVPLRRFSRLRIWPVAII